MNTITAPSASHAIAGRPTDFPAASVGAEVGLRSTDRALREEILHRAYAIWEREGHPRDRKLANWLEAEAAVMAPPSAPPPA